VRGTLLAPSSEARGVASNREAVGEFELRAQAVVVTSGGIGHAPDIIRANWPVDRLGPAPKHMIPGVPAHVDGRMIGIAEAAGARLINRDRMWHYVEGVENFAPIWPNHGIRVLPGPSSLWFDATGQRLPAPNFPGFDSLGTLRHIGHSGYDYTWFVTTKAIIEKEFALSGSEQNPDFTGKDVKFLVKNRLAKGAPVPVQKFIDHGVDFVQARTLDELVVRMNELTASTPDRENAVLDVERLRRQIEARDAEVDNPYSKDLQVMAIANARRFRSDRVVRVAKPHRFLDPANAPLHAVRLNILSRKTLGGLETNLDSQVMRADGRPFPGLYAAGEVAGFGGGGVHGYNALEGTFLGGCIFSGLRAGRALAGSLQ
jgi:predicted oxidoreductase